MTAGSGTGQGAAVDLTIIVVSYNSRDVTLEALRSALAETRDISVEIICVDNASHDGSAAAIAWAFPGIHLIALEQNIGFAAANNLAATMARGRRLLLLNPDTITIERGIDRLWQFAERRSEAGIWGGRTLYGDRSLNPTSCWARMRPWDLFCWASGLTYLFPRWPLVNREAYAGWPRDSEREVDIVTGCFFMIDRALWERLRGFDPTFFMYGEEADLCHRAVAIGARPAVSPDATIIHLGGVSEASSADKMVKVLRGKVTLMRVHWRPAWRRVGVGLFWGLAALRLVGQKVIQRRQRRHKDAYQGAGLWSEVWARRGEWLAGWPATPAADGLPLAARRLD